MLRTLFVAVFLSIYILIVGPPLLVWTLVTKNPNAIYWAGTNGVMFFVRLVGVRVRVVGTERIPAETCIFAANHTSSADAPAVVTRNQNATENSTWDQTSLIGKIFIGFGALLTMASAARMFMA